jgi:hypothetical protein
MEHTQNAPGVPTVLWLLLQILEDASSGVAEESFLQEIVAHFEEHSQLPLSLGSGDPYFQVLLGFVALPPQEVADN